MRTSRVFVYSLALSIILLFAFNVLIGYAQSQGYPSALGGAFRRGLEISVVLAVVNWILNQIKNLRKKVHSTIEQISRKRPKQNIS